MADDAAPYYCTEDPADKVLGILLPPDSDPYTVSDAKASLSAEDLATPDAFRRDPEMVWKWYEWRRELMRNALPNPAHRAIARLEQLAPSVTVITQNVDGLHVKAGSSNVIELHGNIWRNFCFDCMAPAAELPAGAPLSTCAAPPNGCPSAPRTSAKPRSSTPR